MKRVQILGVPIDPVSLEEAVSRIMSMVNDGAKHHVMTPNSEMLIEAHGNVPFKTLLRSGELNIPDSAGLLFAATVTSQDLPERVAGVDVVEKLCSTIGSDHPVFFLGGRSGVGRRASEALQKKNPRLVVAGVHEGSPSDADASEIIKKINGSGAHILFVAYGAPAQDLWINQYLMNLVPVKVAMGIGGSFDFLAGSIKRAPKWMRSARLEWLWRLVLEPRRIGRIFRAVIVFPIYILRYGRGG